MAEINLTEADFSFSKNDEKFIKDCWKSNIIQILANYMIIRPIECHCLNVATYDPNTPSIA